MKPPVKPDEKPDEKSSVLNVVNLPRTRREFQIINVQKEKGVVLQSSYKGERERKREREEGKKKKKKKRQKKKKRN